MSDKHAFDLAVHGAPEFQENIRTELQSQVELFIRGGGEIQEIEPNVMADPPQKPTNNYGSRPI
jgi:hypothetical protein